MITTKLSLLAMLNEVYKRLLIMWDYKFNVLTQLVMIGLIFVGASYFMAGGRFDPSQLVSIFLGYIVWFYARIIIVSSTADLMNEAQEGTLEQMYMTPVPTEMLVLGRVLATLVSTTIMVALTAAVLALLLGIHIPMHWEGVVVFLLTLVGLFGFTLILSGVGLVFKQVDALADLMQNMLLFLTGSLLPVSRFPNWLETIAQTLPTTQGIIVLRNVVLNGQSLTSAWSDGSLVWLTLHSALYVCCGWLVFKWCERIAKQRGSLSQY